MISATSWVCKVVQRCAGMISATSWVFDAVAKVCWHVESSDLLGV